MSRSHWITSFALIAAVALMGCRSDEQAAMSTGGSSGASRASGGAMARVADLNLPSGTSIDVTLGTIISSEA